MKYEVIENAYEPGTWNVEAFDDEGGCLMARFSGPGAEQRAREYAEWMNSKA